MKCYFDPVRIERCLACNVHCTNFIGWYHKNKEVYNALIEKHVTSWPDKYEKRISFMAKQNNNMAGKKQIAAIDSNNTLVFTGTLEEAKKMDISILEGLRLVELTGKEYQAIVSITFKQMPLSLNKKVSGERTNKSNKGQKET